MSGPTALPQDPLEKSRLRLEWRDRKLELSAPYSVFSNTWIDQGTLLLLENLPSGEPGTFLDLGCGYGALGLPIAAALPASRGLLVDRDLLAVAYTRKNVIPNRVRNVSVVGSLGYRGIPSAWGAFDWILSNLPARAGDRAFAHFLAEGARRLAPGGSMRVVVIAPLAPGIESLAKSLGLVCEIVAATEQHAVLAISGVGTIAAGDAAVDTDTGEEAVYHRDTIEVSLAGLAKPLRLLRPTDLADEPHRLAESVPFLAESLPKALPEGASILVFRCGYGLLPALVLERFPGASVVAVDRDLLGTEFTRRNCAVGSDRLSVIESASLDEALQAGPYDLVVGELLSPLGLAGTALELAQARRALKPGGTAMVAGHKKTWRELREAEPGATAWQRVIAGEAAAVFAASCVV